MHAIAMKWDELARTCDDLPWISPQYMTVRRVAARSAHNQRVLWSWHLVCSGPALPQQIDRWRLTARPACWGSKISFVFATSLRNFDNTKVIGTSTSHKALEQWSLFSSGYVRVWAQQNSWWLKSPGTYIYICSNMMYNKHIESWRVSYLLVQDFSHQQLTVASEAPFGWRYPGQQCCSWWSHPPYQTCGSNGGSSVPIRMEIYDDQDSRLRLINCYTMIIWYDVALLVKDWRRSMK